MNTNLINNGVAIVEHSLSEQYSDVGNQQCVNSIENQSNSARSDNVNNNLMKSPMIPTPLYIFFSCLRLS
jgi:hypothetical protein